MNTIERFIETEKAKPITEITWNGWQLWPYLRVYIGSQIAFEQDRRVNIQKLSFLKIIGAFFYGFFNWFGKYDTIVLTSSNQRKMFQGKYRAGTDLLPGKCLIIEQPTPSHFKRSQVPAVNIVSKVPIYIREALLKPFIKIGRINNEALIESIKNDFNVNVEHRQQFKRFVAQYKVYSNLLKRKKPKQVFVINSYVNMAFVKAANDLNIPTTEIQHGVITEAHYAYNIAQPLDATYYPSNLLTLGSVEKNVFHSNNNFIDQMRVYPIGSFSIDYINSTFKPNRKLEELLKDYNYSVAVTSQDAFEEKIISFISTTAKLNPDVAFVFIPRSGKASDYPQFKNIDNIVFANGLNTYEIIKHCSFHTTITSTCAIESISLGVPNVLMNIEGKAKSYYGDNYNEEKFTWYVTNPDEFGELLRKTGVTEKTIVIASNKSAIIPGFKENLKAWVS